LCRTRGIVIVVSRTIRFSALTRGGACEVYRFECLQCHRGQIPTIADQGLDPFVDAFVQPSCGETGECKRFRALDNFPVRPRSGRSTTAAQRNGPGIRLLLPFFIPPDEGCRRL
jgi:hypothetical protein